MANTVNIRINQGEDFSSSLMLLDANKNPMSFANVEFYGGLKIHYESANVVAYTIHSNSSSGVVTYSLDHDTSWSLVNDTYKHDLWMRDLSSNVATKLIQGTAYVSRGVSEPQ